MDDKKIDFDSLFEGLDFSSAFDNPAARVDQLGFWFPEGYKDRYAALQKASQKKFGRLVQELIKRCIERAEAVKPESTESKAS
jgi:hypothetical protein